MMEWTDRWCRRFHRLLTKQAVGFTEMAVADAVIHGDRERIIGFDPAREAPIALQLGGSDPEKLADAARIGADFGYNEINLNVGCPSDRVQGGNFGACLMRDPDLVARCMAAMSRAVNIPVTVKCRIGVDDQNPHQVLPEFVDRLADIGVRRFYIHARKAWLKGLSPKDNRTIPPLDYDLVRHVKATRPDLEIILNGGLRDVAHGLAEMRGPDRGPDRGPERATNDTGTPPETQGSAKSPPLDGMMLGRAAYETPWILSDVDRLVFAADTPSATMEDVIKGLESLGEEARSAGLSVHAVTRHAMGLFHARPGARSWRRALSDIGQNRAAGPECIARAASAVLRQANTVPPADIQQHNA